MNEIRDLIIGIDIGKEYTQICYYDRKAEEARSLSMKVGASQYEAPGCICYRTDHGDYCVGLEAEYFAREKGGIMIGNIYDICQKEEKIQVAGEEKEPAELLAHFLRGILKFLGIQDIVKNTRCLCPSHRRNLVHFRYGIIRRPAALQVFHVRNICLWTMARVFIIMRWGRNGNLESKCRMVCLCRRYGNLPEADYQRLFQTGACKTGGSGQYKA